MQTLSSSHRHFSEEQLLDIFAKSKDATAIYTGEQFYIQFANEQLIQLFGKGPEIIGQPLLEIVPELADHPYLQLLWDVWKDGQAKNIEGVSMQIDGMEAPALFDLIYFPVLDKAGHTYCILQTAIELSEEVCERRAEASRVKDALALNQRLNAQNQQLIIEHRHAHKDRERLWSMIDSSPVAMLIFRGDNFIFEEVNLMMRSILKKDESIKGQELMKVMPELEGQPILSILKATYRTGKEHRVIEEPVQFLRDNELYHGYFNITYTALRENGQITGVMQLAVDVTETVLGRQRIQRTEERLRLAVEAAHMGTFSVHTPTMAFEGSARFRQLFGFSPNDALSYDACMNRIGEDFREAVAAQISSAMETGERVEMEFTVTGYPGHTERWVRGAGTLQRNRHGIGEYFTGIVMEVSEQMVEVLIADR